MSTTLIWDNLVRYSLQIGLLVALAAFVPAVLRLRLPGARLVYWHVLLAACLMLPLVRPWKQQVVTDTIEITTTMTAIRPSAPGSRANLPRGEVALLLLAAGAMLRLGWLGAGFWRLRQYRRHSRPLDPAPAWSAEATPRISQDIASPVTFGFRRPVILLPARFPQLEARVREAILCHELLHVRRHDWLFTVAEELIRAALWFHPAIWWLLGEIGLAREQAVDRKVIELTQSRDEYVDALLAIAGATPRLDLALAPLFLRKRHLKQRVISILREVRMSKTRLISALAAGLGILAVACWFVTGTFPLAAAPQVVADAPGVAVDMGGATLMHRTPVQYPEAARRKGVQGTVVVQVTLDASGNVSDAGVLSGPQELRKAALESVLKWHFARDAALSTRQVSLSFQVPPESSASQTATFEGRTYTVETSGPGATAEARAKAAAEAAQHEAQLTEARAKLETLARQKQLNADQKQDAAQVDAYLAEARARVAAMQKEEMELRARRQGPAALAGRTIKSIDIRGLSDASRSELLARLPVHEGDTLAADSQQRIQQAINEFDEHMRVSIFSPSPTEVSIQITSPDYSEMNIRVGGNVQQNKLIKQPRPMYPPEAKQAHIQGVVKLNAIIARDGTVKHLEVISGHPLLATAALEAVRQWVYETTLLNGEPVEVQTQIDVNFTLSQ